jgi:membrane protease YdiL (CAAX protease family)
MAADQEPIIIGAPPSALSRSAQRIECGIFLLLILPQALVSSSLSHQIDVSFVTAAIAIAMRDAGLVGLIFLLLSRNGERFSNIGWTFTRGYWYVAAGLIVFPAFLYGQALLQTHLMERGWSAHQPPPYLLVHAREELPLAVLISAINGIAEEIIFRGYLLMRLTAITGRADLAIVASAGIFGIGHLYQGSSSVVVLTFLGAALGIIVVRTKSLVIPIVVHALQDLVAIVAASHVH